MIEKSVYNMNATEYLNVIKLYNVDVELNSDTISAIYDVYKTYCLDMVDNNEDFLKLALVIDIISARGYETADDMKDVASAIGVSTEDISAIMDINAVIALRMNLDLEQTIEDTLAALNNKKITKPVKLIYTKAVLNYAIASPEFNSVATSVAKVIEFINTCSEGDLDATSSILSYMINKMEA